jgi:hypothetical protein
MIAQSKFKKLGFHLKNNLFLNRYRYRIKCVAFLPQMSAIFLRSYSAAFCKLTKQQILPLMFSRRTLKHPAAIDLDESIAATNLIKFFSH